MAPPSQYPPVKIPPKKARAASSTRAVFTAYINGHPALKQWANGIFRNALDYGIDPTYFASLINTESGGHHIDPTTGKINTSSAGALGLGQIMTSHIGEPIPWAPGRTVTLANLQDPGFNLRWSAWYFGQKLSAAGGNYDQAYRGAGGYNQGGPQIFQDVPRGYVPTTTAKSPTDAAKTAVEIAGAKADLTSQWAVYSKGKLKFVPAATPPPRTLTDPGNGLPLSAPAFLSLYGGVNGISSVWEGFTGKRPSYNQAADVIAKRWSDYRLKAWLAARPDFVGSPVWKQNAPSYIAAWHSVYGENAKPDVNAIKYAVLHVLDATAFVDQLRRRPDFVDSNLFQNDTAAFASVYRQIYGEPDANGLNIAKQAALAGWSQPQFETYLRQQPEYTSSTEYQSKALSLLDALGLITGQQAVLLPGAAGNQLGTAATLPTDKRVAAAGQPSGLPFHAAVSGEPWQMPSGQPWTEPALPALSS